MVLSGQRALRRGFGALQMFYWCAYGSFSTYFVAFVTDRGMGAAHTGLMLSLYMLCACAGQFIINAVCDRFQNNRRVFIVATVVVLALYFGLYFAPNIAMLAVLYALLGFVQPAVAAVLDTWVLRSFADDPEAYGPIRATASIAFAVMILAEGFAISRFGYGVTLVLATIFVSGGVALAFFMPEIPKVERREREQRAFRFGDVSPAVWMMIISLLLMGGANAPVLQMSHLILKGLGGSVTHVGIAICASALSEFPMMRMRRMLRCPVGVRLMVASALCLISTLVTAAAQNTALVIAMYAVSGFAYGLLLPARRQMISEQTPAHLQNRMHGIGDAAYGSVGGFGGNLLGGAVLQAAGVRAMLLMATGVHALSLVLMAVLYGHRAGRNKSQQDMSQN